jgi:hypothetical protein
MSSNQNGRIQQNNKIKRAANYLSTKMPSANLANPNPVETLSTEDISYLQAYLEQIKNKKISEQTKYNNPDFFEPRNGFGMGNGVNQNLNANTGFSKQTPLNRATDIYNPLGREVPVDWRTFNNSGSMEKQFFQNPQNIEPGSRGAAPTRPGKRSQQVLNFDQPNNYYNPYEYGAKQDSLAPLVKQPYNGPYVNDPEVIKQMGVNNLDANYNCQPHIRNINVESSLLQREMTHLPGQRELTQKEINRFELLPFDPQDHRHIVWSDNMPRGGYPTRTDRLEL